MKSLLSVSSCVVLALGLAACRIQTETRYVLPDGNVEATADSAYTAGDKVVVSLTGVTTAGINYVQNGGIVVQTGDVDRVSVSARVIGYGYAEDKDDVTTAMRDVAKTVAVSKSGNTWTVSCGQESQGGGDAGCEYLEVTVPRGTTDSPLDVTIDADNGIINANFENDVVRSLVADNTGPGGDIVAQADPQVGATFSLKSENGPVRLDLPSDVSVDEVRLRGRAKADTASGDTFSDCDFADNVPFDGTSFGIGTRGEGAASVTLTSTGDVVRLKKPGSN